MSTQSVQATPAPAILSEREYRKLLNDKCSTSEQVQKRIEYLEAFCRNIIRIELEHHVKAHKERVLPK